MSGRRRRDSVRASTMGLVGADAVRQRARDLRRTPARSRGSSADLRLAVHRHHRRTAEPQVVRSAIFASFT